VSPATAVVAGRRAQDDHPSQDEFTSLRENVSKSRTQTLLALAVLAVGAVLAFCGVLSNISFADTKSIALNIAQAFAEPRKNPAP